MDRNYKKMTENILKILFIQIYLAKIARAKVSAGKNPSETYKGEAIPYDQQYKHSFSKQRTISYQSTRSLLGINTRIF